MNSYFHQILCYLTLSAILFGPKKYVYCDKRQLHLVPSSRKNEETKNQIILNLPDLAKEDFVKGQFDYIDKNHGDVSLQLTEHGLFIPGLNLAGERKAYDVVDKNDNINEKPSPTVENSYKDFEENQKRIAELESSLLKTTDTADNIDEKRKEREIELKSEALAKIEELAKQNLEDIAKLKNDANKEKEKLVSNKNKTTEAVNGKGIKLFTSSKDDHYNLPNNTIDSNSLSTLAERLHVNPVTIVHDNSTGRSSTDPQSEGKDSSRNPGFAPDPINLHSSPQENLDVDYPKVPHPKDMKPEDRINADALLPHPKSDEKNEKLTHEDSKINEGAKELKQDNANTESKPDVLRYEPKLEKPMEKPDGPKLEVKPGELKGEEPKYEEPKMEEPKMELKTEAKPEDFPTEKPLECKPESIESKPDYPLEKPDCSPSCPPSEAKPDCSPSCPPSEGKPDCSPSCPPSEGKPDCSPSCPPSEGKSDCSISCPPPCPISCPNPCPPPCPTYCSPPKSNGEKNKKKIKILILDDDEPLPNSLSQQAITHVAPSIPFQTPLSQPGRDYDNKVLMRPRFPPKQVHIEDQGAFERPRYDLGKGEPSLNINSAEFASHFNPCSAQIGYQQHIYDNGPAVGVFNCQHHTSRQLNENNRPPIMSVNEDKSFRMPSMPVREEKNYRPEIHYHFHISKENLKDLKPMDQTYTKDQMGSFDNQEDKQSDDFSKQLPVLNQYLPMFKQVGDNFANNFRKQLNSNQISDNLLYPNIEVPRGEQRSSDQYNPYQRYLTKRTFKDVKRENLKSASLRIWRNMKTKRTKFRKKHAKKRIRNLKGK